MAGLGFRTLLHRAVSPAVPPCAVDPSSDNLMTAAVVCCGGPQIQYRYGPVQPIKTTLMFMFYFIFSIPLT